MKLLGIKKDEEFIPASGKKDDSAFKVKELKDGEFTMCVYDDEESACLPIAIFSEEWKGVYN